MTPFQPALAPSALIGRRIFITGVGSGIGRAIARRASALGAEVGGCGRRAEPLQDTAWAIERDGGRFSWWTCDVCDSDATADALKAFARQGGLHGLVNNAGGQFYAPADEITVNGWNAVLDLNLTAVFLLAQTAYPLLRAAGGGAIINLSIAPAERGALGLAHAVAARSGVAGLSRALALEWGQDGINVNCVAPAAVETPALLQRCSAQFIARLASATPMRRNATLDEIAELAAFLLTPAARLITGQVLRIDGGSFLGAPIDMRPSAEVVAA